MIHNRVRFKVCLQVSAGHSIAPPTAQVERHAPTYCERKLLCFVKGAEGEPLVLEPTPLCSLKPNGGWKQPPATGMCTPVVCEAHRSRVEGTLRLPEHGNANSALSRTQTMLCNAQMQQ